MMVSLEPGCWVAVILPLYILGVRLTAHFTAGQWGGVRRWRVSKAYEQAQEIVVSHKPKLIRCRNLGSGCCCPEPHARV